MVPEDLLFWIGPISGSRSDDRNVLCLRHADAMSVPRGWTLDDRREEIPRLFMPSRFDTGEPPERGGRRSRRSKSAVPAEQLVIDGTGEIGRPDTDTDSDSASIGDADDDGAVAPSWKPSFDQSDDLGGLLEVSSPLLARAFRGAERRTS